MEEIVDQVGYKKKKKKGKRSKMGWSQGPHTRGPTHAL